MLSEGAFPSDMKPWRLFLQEANTSRGIQFVRWEGINSLPEPDKPSTFDIPSGLLRGDILGGQSLDIKRSATGDPRMEGSD
jgi:hypothetical protein